MSGVDDLLYLEKPGKMFFLNADFVMRQEALVVYSYTMRVRKAGESDPRLNNEFEYVCVV